MYWYPLILSSTNIGDFLFIFIWLPCCPTALKLIALTLAHSKHKENATELKTLQIPIRIKNSNSNEEWAERRLMNENSCFFQGARRAAAHQLTTTMWECQSYIGILSLIGVEDSNFCLKKGNWVLNVGNQFKLLKNTV